jgi:hypothetical protein
MRRNIEQKKPHHKGGAELLQQGGETAGLRYVAVLFLPIHFWQRLELA